MSLSLQILEGREALSALRRLHEDGSWHRLAGADPRPTCFQEAPFVLSWYDAYDGLCEPLVALAHTAEAGDDRLVGMLSLAIRRGGEIVIAGANHAWYEGWIAEPGHDAEFIAAAVDAVIERRRPAAWRWKYLVRGAGAGWVDALTNATGLVTEHPTPIWDLTAPDAIERLLKPRLRNYMNRYQKRGELALERLVDAAAIRAIHVCAPWSDLRHGAVRADLPFRDDPRKMTLHEHLARAGDAIHTSVLRLDDRPLAVHQGNWDGERLFTGLYAFDPTQARQSPGNILMIELARHVLELGGREIDLTPGGEWWKNDFATRQETVYRVELFADAGRRRLRRLRDGVVGGAKTLLGAIGVETEDVRKLAGSLRGQPPRTDAIEVFDIDVSNMPEPATAPLEELDGVDAPWLERILSIDQVRDRERAAAFLLLSSRLISRGWRPLTHDTEAAPGTVLWAQPRGIAAVIPDEHDIEPIALVRNPGNAPPGVPVPEDVEVVLVGRDLGNPEVIAELLGAARICCARDRLWVVATDLKPATRNWLAEHGCPVALEQVAA